MHYKDFFIIIIIIYKADVLNKPTKRVSSILKHLLPKTKWRRLLFDKSVGPLLILININFRL